MIIFGTDTAFSIRYACGGKRGLHVAALSGEDCFDTTEFHIHETFHPLLAKMGITMAEEHSAKERTPMAVSRGIKELKSSMNRNSFYDFGENEKRAQERQNSMCEWGYEFQWVLSP